MRHDGNRHDHDNDLGVGWEPAWLRISRDVFDRLWAFRSERALPSWEAAIETLLARAAGPRAGGDGAGRGE